MIVSLKCAKDSETVFYLYITHKLQAIEIKSNLSVNLCIYIYVYIDLEIQTSGVIGSESLSFPNNLQYICFDIIVGK